MWLDSARIRRAINNGRLDRTMASELVELHTINPNERNPRTITPDALMKLCESIERDPAFMELRPIIIDENRMILGGNQRFRACQKLGMKNVPSSWVMTATGLTDEQRKRFILVDNAPDGMAGQWDMEILAAEWRMPELSELGFDMDDLAARLPTSNDADAEPQIDRAEELRIAWGVESGQTWELGDHLLLCGDSTKREDVDRVMGCEKAAVCLTDPPYGLGDNKASGKNSYDEYKDTRANLEVLASKWLPIAREVASVVCFSPGVTNAWIYPEASWMMCWFYGGGQLRSSWGFNCWQPFLCYGKDPSLANGRGARPDAVNMNTPANAADIDHPCPKPTKLWEWFIERLSFDRADTFYEPFSGSGTTIIACEQLGRKCRAIELSPGYVAVSLQRFKDATGKTPTLVDAK